ncbi:hypothetical protein [Terrabacter sp. NPDC000476]|uniref:hypothetical protein n=1 Tax=Terrabacter sp. NPDC000476 TaxID=3154258 RepID=UPI00332B2562
MTEQNPSLPDTRPRAKLLDLSLTQLLGGSMAAATAAALGSRLGVVGTIAGAAVLSVISAVAASLYTGSMARAREVVVLVRNRRGELEPATADEPRWSPAPRQRLRRPDRATTRRILATTGAVFALAAAFVTGLQLTTGAQVTGTSIGGRAVAGSGEGTTGRSDGSGGPASPATATTPATTATTTTPAVPDTPATTPSTDLPGSTASGAPSSTPSGTTDAPDVPGATATAPGDTAPAPTTGGSGAAPTAPVAPVAPVAPSGTPAP